MIPADIGLPDPPAGKLYIVTAQTLSKLKKKVEGLVRLEMGPGLKLIKGDSKWRIELDLISDGEGTAGSGAYQLKEVTICEGGNPVTYKFLVQL